MRIGSENYMSYEMVAVLFAPKTVAGAAKNFDELIKILQSELTTAGFNPKPDVDSGGNFFRLKAGFGASAKVYYRAVGDDAILTPEVRPHRGWVLVLLCCIPPFLIPPLIGIIIRDRNVKKAIRRLPTVLEATNSNYKARFPLTAPAYVPPSVPTIPETGRKCVYCGSKIEIDDIYCQKCGKKQ